MNLLLMADGPVGLAVARWLLENYRQDVTLVLSTSENEISAVARAANVESRIYNSSANFASHAFDLGLLAWWPKLIRPPLVTAPRLGFLNTHPSLLPHNRGKHFSFWALVEQAPFGVSLHMVNEGVDSGDIVAQRAIETTWEDTGETLYRKAQAAMVALVQDTYPQIRELAFPRTQQDPAAGSFHRASELEPASRIQLDARYTARELLNLLRARTFAGHPACSFVEAGETYEVRIEIRKKQPPAKP